MKRMNLSGINFRYYLKQRRDPTNEASRFTAKIEMRSGEPVVTREPDLNTNGIQRMYKVYGKENLTDAAWAYPTNALHRFFKVTVEMP